MIEIINGGCCERENAIYNCAAEHILTWDIYDEMDIILFTASFTIHDLIRLNYSETILSSSLVGAELILTNFTFVFITLKIYGIQALNGYHVYCGGDRILISPGKSKYLKHLNYYPIVYAITSTSCITL